MTRDKEFYRTIFRIALPSAFQALVSFLVVIADNIMVSFIGDGVSAQAAVSQVNSITAFYTAAILGLTGGSAVLISQYWGKGDTASIRRVFAIVMTVCAGTAALFTAAALLFPQAIVEIMVKSSEAAVVSDAVLYFSIVCLSYLPYALSYSLVGMLRSVEVVKITLIITVAALATNIGLNYVLIFGKLGFPAMGVAGAAIATVAARVVEMLIVWFYTFRVQKKLPIRPADLFHHDRQMWRDYAKYGLPVAVTDIQWSLVGILKAAIIGQMGAVFMAANSISNSMADLGTLFTFALAGGACVVVGKAVGKGDYARVREYSKTIQILFALIGVVMAAVVFLLRKPFVALYGSASDPQVYALSVAMISILSVTLVGTSYHASCFVGINRGAGDSRFVAMVDMICGWLVVLPLTALAAFVWHAPLPIVFLCTRIDQCFKWIIAFFRLRGSKWIKNVTR
ncbi:MAG: MATE family efflux transporter [Eubacteriales bacterium]|nr:MATE family efflux transporter [Eubacteriales bacterium]